MELQTEPAEPVTLSTEWWDDHPDRGELDPSRPADHELSAEFLR